MAPYIFMERNGIHIIDLKQTQALLDEAAEAAGRFAAQGKKILFVGTKKQAQDVVRKEAERAGMPYVVDRWLGGMLTNFQTIRKSLRRMETLQPSRSRTARRRSSRRRSGSCARREREKLERVLGGIADMGKLPGALFVVDIKREHIAVDEAQKLDIPVIALVDTNCDPDLVDFPIPANDDAMKSVALFTRVIADADRSRAQTAQVERSRQAQKAESRRAEAGSRGRQAGEAKSRRGHDDGRRREGRRRRPRTPSAPSLPLAGKRGLRPRRPVFVSPPAWRPAASISQRPSTPEFMSIDLRQDVKRLRETTGVGMMDCKKALTEADGDFDAAIELLRKKGQKVAAKRADREATEGVIATATTTPTHTAGVIAEVNSETDFVARNDDFTALRPDASPTLVLARAPRRPRRAPGARLRGRPAPSATPSPR